MIDPNVLQNLKDRLDLQKSQYPFATPLFEILSKVVSMVQEMKARVDRVEKMEGPKGGKGDQGDTGPQGERGLDGSDGMPGKDGNDGKQGKMGLTGPAGERGERGLQGIQGVKGDRGDKGEKGDNGSPDTAEQVRDKLSSLKGQDRLDAKSIKNLPEVVREVRSVFGSGGQVKDIVAGTGVSVEKSDSGKYTVSATGGTGSSDFADDVFSVHDNVDATKILKFELSDLASPRTVTVRVPEMDTAGGEPDVLVLAQESFGGGSYRVGADWEFADINIGTPSVGFLTILPTHSTPGTQTNLYNTQTADRLQYLANANNATYLPWNSGATDGHLPLAGSLVYGGGANTALAELAIGAANAVLHVNSGATAPEWSSLTYVQSTARLGVGVAAPTYAISISGEAAQTIAMERELTASTAGRNLTVQAGGAVSGGSNRAGGKVILSGGISTGTQGSTAEIWTAAGGSSGTTDRTPSVKLAIAATGAASFTQNAVAGAGITGTTFSTTAPSVGANGFIGQSWNFNSLLLADGSAYGLQMQLSSSVANTDTGASGVNGFAFELYCSTEDDTVNHPGATAVGGFIQATGPGRTGPMIGAQYQTNVAADADAFYGVSVAPNFINTGATLDVYTGLRILNFATFSGTITTTYGIYMEDLSAQNANAYSIYSLGGLGVHVGNFMFGSTSAATEQIELADAKNIKFQTTTGTKIGTATSQKMGFWNAAPIVQPTTGIAAATFTANTSGIANDTATFDGYTIGQIVKALRNSGLLA